MLDAEAELDVGGPDGIDVVRLPRPRCPARDKEVRVEAGNRGPCRLNLQASSPLDYAYSSFAMAAAAPRTLLEVEQELLVGHPPRRASRR